MYNAYQQVASEFKNDTVRVRFNSSGMEVKFSLPDPDQYEIGAFNLARMHIDIGKYDRIGFFVIDFGSGFSIDAPFDAGIEDEGDLPTFGWFANEECCSLTLIGVDPCKGNKIFGRCDVALSPLVSEHLKNQIKMQIETRVNSEFSFSVVNEMYEHYPHAAAMKSILSTNGEIAMNHKENDFARRDNNIRNANPDSMSPRDVILRHFADMPHILSTRTYPIELPRALAPWHCHTDDGGHSILCLASAMIEENKSERHLILPFDMDENRTEYNVESILSEGNLGIEKWLMPFTVKGVLRGYRVERGFIVCNVECSVSFGPLEDDADYEF